MNEIENYNSQPAETAPWDTEKQTFKPNTYLATTIVITLFYFYLHFFLLLLKVECSAEQ